MRVQVDATKCEGYGTCADHCPSLFQPDEWGFAAVIGDGTVAEADQSAARTAAADCPEHAILVED